MRLAVTQDIEGKTGILNLLVSDVLFMEYDLMTRWISVHTLEEQYFITGTLSYWQEALKPQGFSLVDRSYLVQISKIRKIDSVFLKAYFDASSDGTTKCVTLSQKFFKQLKKQLQSFHAGVAFN